MPRMQQMRRRLRYTIRTFMLYRESVIAETVRFLRQFSHGYGDTMAEREALLGDQSLDELIAGIRVRQSTL